ncbi:MAG: tRNA uridine-5-carboxymethylaminomethyl(34) synthesis GTPase MnmE [Verrucomicrobiota bacterium]
MSRHFDTIAALATPVGTAAIAVVRISGSDTFKIATALCGQVPAARVATHIDYRDDAGQLIDDVLLTFFKGPQSYTGEDSLEVSSHGNPFIAQRILEDLLARGCRPAEPGEFTQRAFLNGRMDLSQAEAVMDLIHARSERALAAANAQLRGSLGRKMEELIAALLSALARIEAYIDFPDEDLPPEDQKLVREQCQHISLSINNLIATSRYGEMLRDGVKTVIVGAPNAGKSSLLNALVGRDRALVSAEPGTTRDFIEERIIVGPHSLRLIDTAGLNPSPAPLEKMGMAKTLERAAEADLFLVVLDSSLREPPALPADLLARLTAGTTLVVLNKTDLSPALPPLPQLVGLPTIKVSALSGAGIEELRLAIAAKADAFAGSTADGIAINARHAHALAQARTGVAEALAKLTAGGPAELVASDLRAVLAAFGEITGRIDNERMLDQLFASFCIGK